MTSTVQANRLTTFRGAPTSTARQTHARLGCRRRGQTRLVPRQVLGPELELGLRACKPVMRTRVIGPQALGATTPPPRYPVARRRRSGLAWAVTGPVPADHAWRHDRATSANELEHARHRKRVNLIYACLILIIIKQLSLTL